MSLPMIGITMGDAAGISPEILVKSLADPAIRTFCEPVVLGDVRVLAGRPRRPASTSRFAASSDRRSGVAMGRRSPSSTTTTSIPRR